MIVIISNPAPINNEAIIVNQLFNEGLEFFHLRKPKYSLKELSLLLSQIDNKYYSKIALHQHHKVAEDFGLNRFHYTEENRKKLKDDDLYKHKVKGRMLSSSIHDAEEYQNLSSHFDYVFFGPVFNSISKSGYSSILKNDFRIPSLGKIKMIALGGIDNSKINETKKYGFDGIALLGNIWNEPKNAIKNFKIISKEWIK
jgi:thiamine-phosphate pyrophosphorylase